MNSAKLTVDQVLDRFDVLTNKSFDELDVRSALQTLIAKDTAQDSLQLQAESMAFNVSENYQNQPNGWGTYFGPMIVWRNEDGSMTESPSINFINPEMIDYWEQRGNKTVNPILRARYFDLVWDLKKKITGESPSHTICRNCINSLIDIANGDFYKHPIDVISKLKRALELAISINEYTLINCVKLAILSFEDRHSVDDKPGLWGYSFDLLIDNKKVRLLDVEEERIIEKLEARLTRLTVDNSAQRIDPWAAELAAKRLALYYRKRKKNYECHRVILEIGKAYYRLIDNAPAIQAGGWLEHLYRLYVDYDLKEEATSVLIKLRELQPKMSAELKSISHSVEFSRDEMNSYISAMISGDLNQCLHRIAAHYIPEKEKAKEQIFDLSKSAPFLYLMSQQIQDEKGRIVATIGALEDDLEGHIARRISESLAFSVMFLRLVIQEAINKKGLSKTHLISFIKNCPVLQEDRLLIIEHALDAFFQNNYLIFIHLIIPQIEEAIRNIVEYSGGNVLKPSNGGYNLRTFDDILRDDIVKQVLGEDFVYYFRVLFTDPRGWNLRNNVCHGIIAPNSFNQQTADRTLHALICLGLIKKK